MKNATGGLFMLEKMFPLYTPKIWLGNFECDRTPSKVFLFWNVPFLSRCYLWALHYMDTWTNCIWRARLKCFRFSNECGITELRCSLFTQNQILCLVLHHEHHAEKSPPLRSFQVSFFLSENTHIDLLSDRMCHRCELIITAVYVTACDAECALRPSICTSNWFNRQRMHHTNDVQLPAADTAHYTVLISAVPPCQFVWVFFF